MKPFLGRRPVVWVLMVAAILPVMGLLVAGVPATHKEPHYYGRSMGDWLAMIEFGTPDAQRHARTALRSRSDKAVPYLIGTLRKLVPSRTRRTSHEVVRRLYWLRPSFAYAFAPPEGTWNDATVIRALGEIGPGAADSIQTLTALSKEQDGIIGPRAEAALLKIRGKQIAPVIEELERTNVVTRRRAALVAAEFGISASAAVPALCRILASHSIEDANAAAFALGRIGADASVSVPALANCLNRDSTAYEAAAALGAFGTNARPAISVLKAQILHAPGSSYGDQLTHLNAQVSLWQIAPDEAKYFCGPSKLIKDSFNLGPYTSARVEYIVQQLDYTNEVQTCRDSRIRDASQHSTND